MKLVLALLVGLCLPARAAERVVEAPHPLLLGAPVLDLHGVTFHNTFTGGQLRLEGQELSGVGRGNFGVVYDHPRADGVVVKLTDHGPETILTDPLRTHEATADGEEKALRPLGEAGVGPKYLARTEIGGRPVSAREKIYGATVEDYIDARRYGEAEHALVINLLQRIAEKRLFPDDMRPPNIMIGTTKLDPEPKAYVVDSTRLKPVDPAVSDAELREALYRQEIIVSHGHDPFVGQFINTKPLSEILEKALGARNQKTLRQRASAFWEELLSHLGHPRP